MEERARVLGQVGDPPRRPLDPAGERRAEARDRAEEGGLAGSVRSDEDRHLATPPGEIHGSEDRPRAPARGPRRRSTRLRPRRSIGASARLRDRPRRRQAAPSTSRPLSGTGVQPRPRPNRTIIGGSAIVTAAVAGGSAGPTRPSATWMTYPASGRRRSRRCSAMSTEQPSRTRSRTVSWTDAAPSRSSCGGRLVEHEDPGPEGEGTPRSPRAGARRRTGSRSCGRARPRCRGARGSRRPGRASRDGRRRGSRGRRPPRARPCRRPAASRDPGRRTRRSGPGRGSASAATSWPQTVIAPPIRPPWKWGMSPLNRRRNDDLPLARRPDDEGQPVVEPAPTSTQRRLRGRPDTSRTGPPAGDRVGHGSWPCRRASSRQASEHRRADRRQGHDRVRIPVGGAAERRGPR